MGNSQKEIVTMNYEEQVKPNVKELTFYKGDSDRLSLRKISNGGMESLTDLSSYKKSQ